MKAPSWYEEALAGAREKVASGAMTRDEADKAIAAQVARHPDLLVILAADRDFDANPGRPLPPELAARLRRVLPPPPGDARAA